MSGGQIRTNGAEGMSSGELAKATGDFLLNLDHANIAFSQIIIELPCRGRAFHQTNNELASIALGKPPSYDFIRCFQK